MSQPLIPWESQNIPDPLQKELDRRKINRGFNFVGGEKGSWQDDKGEWSTYKGPMTSFVRFCSNGAGVATKFDNVDFYEKPGFVLYGGKDFYNSYGFRNTSIGDTNSIIGYMPDGSPHMIENDVTSNYPIHVPPPEIEKITVTIQKELYRRASIDWVCFSPKQLEYMTPYFLVPGITCILEWGWNHFDPSSLIDLNDLNLIRELKNNPYPLYTKHILGSRGNYDVLFGIVTHFEWSIEGTRIRCKTEITSPDRIYAGLTVDASIRSPMESKPDTNKPEIAILGNLNIFVRDILPNIKKVTDVNIKDPRTIDGGIGEFATYLSRIYREKTYKNKWKEIIYGVFYGPELEGKPTVITTAMPGASETVIREKNEDLNSLDYANKDKDFYCKDNTNVWINMGMLIEILNYHSHELSGFKGKPMFHIDIDDCVISGHPNLISTDGSVLLIPNKEAPKYFYGAFGSAATETILTKELFTDVVKSLIANPFNVITPLLPESWTSLNTYSPDNWQWVDEEVTIPGGQGIWAPTGTTKQKRLVYSPQIDSTPTTPNVNTEYDKMGNSDSRENFTGRNLDKDKMEALGLLPDYWLQKVCMQSKFTAYRDDLDSVINGFRYSKIGKNKSFAFPFFDDQNSGIKDTTQYPRRYSGYLKDIYFNVKAFQGIVKDSKTFTDVISKVLTSISSAEAGMWDLRLVSSTGKAETYPKTDPNEAVAMKIVDYRFIYSINRGTVYTFDYFDADSLLQTIKFTPTISNSQAIRTMYAATNNPQNRTVLSDTNELLDYHFKDRLFLDEIKEKFHGITSTESFRKMMGSLQSLVPPEGESGAFQMTMKKEDGSIIVKRLVMPSPDLLKLLLDDEDKENNPRYTGIMPGIQAQFTIQGIGGLRTFMMFLVRNFPEPYSHKNIVFRIIDLTESIEAGKWTTTITAGILPLRNSIKIRLGLVGL